MLDASDAASSSSPPSMAVDINSAEICRICHSPDADTSSENPLISPCLCRGSLKYVHSDCLQRWVKSRGIRVCELCQFQFSMTVTTKPFRQWQKLELTPPERRKVICGVAFHALALTCVIWSLCVLAGKTAQEIRAGRLDWPFWTKLGIAAVGIAGSLAFMYVQCRTYLALCRRWHYKNRTFYIQAAGQELLRPEAEVQATPV